MGSVRGRDVRSRRNGRSRGECSWRHCVPVSGKKKFTKAPAPGAVEIDLSFSGIKRVATRSAKRGTSGLGSSGRRVGVEPLPTGASFTGVVPAATLRAAASRGQARPERQDIRRAVRRAPVSAVVVFVLDCSDSMQTQARITAAQGAVVGLLAPIYQSRYEVAVVVFQDEEARTVLPASRSVARARTVLKNLWIGGATPLAQGLLEARRVARTVRAKASEVEALLVLLSDGESNVPLERGGNIGRELDEITSVLQA
ncbi:MAG: VWA domain-containing protein, partial [Spirochaetaceae bacterium]